MGAPLVAAGSLIGLRPANLDDAPLIARLTDMAGHGLPYHLWSGMAEPGEDPWEIGAERAARDVGAFSWRNARIATWHGAPIGVAITYDLGEAEPIDDDVPDFIRPLCELEAEVAGTHYINVLAVLPQARRRGAARVLIEDVASRTARDLTLIVASDNPQARALYAALGFEEIGRAPMGSGGPQAAEGDWILLRRRAA